MQHQFAHAGIQKDALPRDAQVLGLQDFQGRGNDDRGHQQQAEQGQGYQMAETGYVKGPRALNVPGPVDHPGDGLEKGAGGPEQAQQGNNRQGAAGADDFLQVVLDETGGAGQVAEDELQKRLLQHFGVKEDVGQHHHAQDAGKEGKDGVVGHAGGQVIGVPGQHFPGDANQHNHRAVVQERQVGHPFPQAAGLLGRYLPGL